MMLEVARSGGRGPERDRAGPRRGPRRGQRVELHVPAAGAGRALAERPRHPARSRSPALSAPRAEARAAAVDRSRAAAASRRDLVDTMRAFTGCVGAGRAADRRGGADRGRRRHRSPRATVAHGLQPLVNPVVTDAARRRGGARGLPQHSGPDRERPPGNRNRDRGYDPGRRAGCRSKPRASRRAACCTRSITSTGAVPGPGRLAEARRLPKVRHNRDFVSEIAGLRRDEARSELRTAEFRVAQSPGYFSSSSAMGRTRVVLVILRRHDPRDPVARGAAPA